MRILSGIILFVLICFQSMAESWIRINQLGYLPQSIKVAVFISDQNGPVDHFQLIDSLTGIVCFEGSAVSSEASRWGMQRAARLNFSRFEKSGTYYVMMDGVRSPAFRIATDCYKGSADYLLRYMRQQRCGFNPYLNDSCHTHDGFIVDQPGKNGQVIDVVGGWHDATDYLQYVTTSANAIYQLLFAYQKNPGSFSDHYDANGKVGADGIPDVLNEARWGLEWLLKMNPDSSTFYNQIADDRDHIGFRLPNKDTARYGNGKFRPVYYITGKTQGLSKYKNRTTGVSSAGGKFSSAYLLGSRLFAKYDLAFSKKLAIKGAQAYRFALSDLGVTQTASFLSPYIYEEENYVDDLELASFEMYRSTGIEYYLKQANYWGQFEPVTPWMERGTARHYQYYPFVNLGHAALAQSPLLGNQYLKNMFDGLTMIANRAKGDPFMNGIPFIWCSNNLVAAAITQARLYEEISGNSTFLEMEASLRDWLFGCNPWGTSMICGLPETGVSPEFPHSSITFLQHVTTHGGLVDGPVSAELYKSLIGIKLMRPDRFAPFQMGAAVYHDDMGDYSSNEPTMDGTASLSYYLSRMESLGNFQNRIINTAIDSEGALVRINNDKKIVYLCFTADELYEGMKRVIKILDEKNVKGNFFLTGNFLRNAKTQTILNQIIQKKHYLGPHSDNHLLYASWDKRDSLLISRESFEEDLNKNCKALIQKGVDSLTMNYFIAPYEWYNRKIVDWSKSCGLRLINFTPGTGTNADYTTPEMQNYRSSRDLIERLFRFESNNPDALRGSIILIHPGTDPKRKDKLYNHLPEIIDQLKARGYSVDRLP